MKHLIREWRGQLKSKAYHLLDTLYLPFDRSNILRTRNIRLIPKKHDRRGGKYAYAEWAHVVGIFQTLMFQCLKNKKNNQILDIGCGTGILGISSEPFLLPDGKYTGIDIMRDDIEFCQKHYPSSHYDFIHFDMANPAYAPLQMDENTSWPIKTESMDLVTALSVWTHLNETDATFYFKEVSRVLKRGCSAIVTFFLLDEVYYGHCDTRPSQEGQYHMTNQDQWVFDNQVYDSTDWFSPGWVTIPEQVVGVTRRGLDRLISESGLALVEYYPGNWKEMPGIFFQDILILEKA